MKYLENENIEKLIEDFKNNDHRELEKVLHNIFGTKLKITGDYIGSTSVDISTETLTKKTFKRAIEILQCNLKSKFGYDHQCIPFVMDELLPNRLGMELWVYK